MITFVSLLLVAVVTFIIHTVIKPKNFPPGPKWYPVVGSSYSVQRVSTKHGSQWKGFSELAKEYSTKVLGVKLGSELVVVVYGEKNIRQAFLDSEFIGRPDNFFFRLRSFGKRQGITFTDGPLWREHRQFTVKHLRNVGFGKTPMEKEIQNELSRMLQSIQLQGGKSLKPTSFLATSVMNVLWKFVAGEKIEEERLSRLLELMTARSKAFYMTGGWLNQLPWIRYIVPQKSGYTLINNINQQIATIIEEAITKHKNKEVPGNDFMYSFMEEINNNRETYTEDQLKAICLDLLIAGSQTTSNTLCFALLVLLRNQPMQNKIYEEIKSVIGDGIPGWTDSHRLIYTSAFLQEVHRFFSIVPTAGPRRLLSDTNIDGYFVPKDTTVLMALKDLHFDPQMWDKPYEFNPDRFIDGSGGLKNIEHLYPFGLGRRRCPGDALAKSFIFITLAGLVQRFQVCCHNGVLPSDEPLIGLLAGPRPFIADFVERT